MPRSVYCLKKTTRYDHGRVKDMAHIEMADFSWTDFDLFGDENSSFLIARFNPSLFGKDFRCFWWIFWSFSMANSDWEWKMDGETPQISSKCLSPISFTCAIRILFRGNFGDSRCHVVSCYWWRWYLFTVLFLFSQRKPFKEWNNYCNRLLALVFYFILLFLSCDLQWL